MKKDDGQKEDLETIQKIIEEAAETSGAHHETR